MPLHPDDLSTKCIFRLFTKLNFLFQVMLCDQNGRRNCSHLGDESAEPQMKRGLMQDHTLSPTAPVTADRRAPLPPFANAKRRQQKPRFLPRLMDAHCALPLLTYKY